MKRFVIPAHSVRDVGGSRFPGSALGHSRLAFARLGASGEVENENFRANFIKRRTKPGEKSMLGSTGRWA
jgi:hypothetical protein